MISKKTLGLAAALAIAGGAHAATYTFELRGSGTYEAPGTDGCSPFDPTSPECPHTVPWLGTLTVQTRSAADGSYTEGTLPSVVLDSNFVSFATDGYATGNLFPAEPVVTIAGGVASLDMQFFDYPWSSFAANGSGASYESDPGTHGGMTSLSGTLLAVPEPAGAALAVAGLAVLGLVRRRRR